MTDDRTLEEELESQDGQPLPDREVMSVVTADPAGDCLYYDGPPPVEAETAPEEPLKGGEPY